MQPITVVAGPTASGKTSRALELAKELRAVVLSADSRMVYRSLDIGTGKPTWEYRSLKKSPWIKPREIAENGPVYSIEGVDHYLLDLVEPGEEFSLANWLDRARALVARLQKSGRAIIVAGGTGLYIKALIEGYDLPPTDAGLRATLEKKTTSELFEELRRVDPVTAAREKPNVRRLIRALEVYRLSGRPISQPRMSQPLPAEVQILELPREELFQRIDTRISERLAAGMVTEVNDLIDHGVSPEWLRSIGLEYRIITEWLLAGNKETNELIARLRKEIHAYARRQQTYLRTQLASRHDS